MDALILARMQFAANITFHILFPTISIALGWWLLFFRWRRLKTRDQRWLLAWRYWTKIFALTFALGVVSGITMSFQFGTNWPGFMERVGNIAGPLLGYEVLTAFFLEATFLGVMLFGHDRVSERMHLLATFLVAFGTTMSAFWILSLNSWMQTPAGHEIVNGEFHVRSWLEVVFNPSFPYRLTHMLMASGLTVSFLLAGATAARVLRGTASAAAPLVLRASLTVAAVLVPVQILVGDAHGLNTLEHQPAKIAAIEGIWHTERGAPLVLFGLPDETARATHHAIEVPKIAALILTHQADGELRGLNEFPNAHPPVAPLFFAFRLMVGIGMAMLAVSWLGWLWLRRHQWQPERLPRGVLQVLRWMSFSGWVATVSGWYVTEIGRQPFVVYGLVRTADVASTTPASHIALTLAGYLVLYALLIAAYIAVLRYMSESPLGPAGAVPEKPPGLKPGRPTPTSQEPDMPLPSNAEWLPVVFMALMGVSMLTYVVLDGYDLGVGMLMHRADGAQRDLMIASIGPFWDANETWLVLGVGILLIAFPKAHGIVLSALYLPVAAMLLGLTLRGVAFDFRVKARDVHKPLWNRAFIVGSGLASLAQGWMLGRYITGFAEGTWPMVFAFMIALTLPAAYVLLGACWLIMKTDGSLQRQAVGWARTAWPPVVLGMGLISIATPLVSATVRARWFAMPEFIALLPIPLITLIALVTARVLLRSLRVTGPLCWLPFVAVVLVFLMGGIGLAYSLYPFVVVDRLTLWQAASAPESLAVILVGVAVAVPAIAVYTVYAYRVFWGKATALTYG